MKPLNIIIAALLLAVVVSLWVFLTTRHKKQATPTKGTSVAKAVGMDEPTTETVQDIIDEHDERECYVYVDATRRATNRMVSGRDLKTIIKEFGSPGRLWNMDGKPVYALNLDTNGHYAPCESFMREDLLNSPRRAYIATQQQAVDVYFQNKDSRNILQKYGAILLFVLAVFFIMFMAISS